MRIDDHEYIERVLSGDSSAFDALVRKYHRLGGAIAFGVLGDFQLAEDAVQDSFVKAYRSLASLRDSQKFRVWFSGIVRKRAIDLLRQRRTKMGRASSLDMEVDVRSGSGAGSISASLTTDARRPKETSSEPALDRVARIEERQKVLESIASLPEEDRTVIVLKHMEGYSYKEIAEVTGATVAAVESRLFRARGALRRKLNSLLELDSPET